MRPKEYYAQYNVAEDSRYIFALIPPQLKGQYIKYIKEPIKSIEKGDKRITCESYFDLETGLDNMDAIWKEIQRASIIIADITGFDSTVMFLLGVALIKKEKVILIAEKSLEADPNLPFNFQTLSIRFYDSDKLDELSIFLKSLLNKMLVIDVPKLLKSRAAPLMSRALRFRKNGEFETAFVLFDRMNEIDPKNWYIYKEWGITYRKFQNHEEANAKLNKALEYAPTNKQRAEIYIELAKLFQSINMENQALQYFEKAEKLDSGNDELYEKWALLYYKMGKFQEAMNKIMMALKLNPNSEDYCHKLEFYTKRFADKTFRMDLEKWLNLKIEEDLKSSRVQPDRIASPKPVYEAKQPTAERDLNFKIDPGPLRKTPTIVKIKKETIKWENTVEMYAQVADIDDEQGVVYLNCKYKKDSDETFERVFPLKHFKNKDKLKVDQSIIVKVLERPGEVRFLFEEADENFFDKDVEDISINDLKDSPIFKPL